jgi:hypothetical protein
MFRLGQAGIASIMLCRKGLLTILIAHLMLMLHYAGKAWHERSWWDVVPALAYVAIVVILANKAIQTRGKRRRQLTGGRLMFSWNIACLLAAHLMLFATYFARAFAQADYTHLIGAAGYLAIFLVILSNTVYRHAYRNGRKPGVRPRGRHPNGPKPSKKTSLSSSFLAARKLPGHSIRGPAPHQAVDKNGDTPR